MGQWISVHWKKAVALGVLLGVALKYLLRSPRFQALFVYLHWVNFPRPVFRTPTKKALFYCGFPGSEHISLPVEDGVVLGGWYLPPPAALGLVREQKEDRTCLMRNLPSSHIQRVVIYFHGNACNRALGYRTDLYKHLHTSNTHVFAFDYRGFGDSTGSPSEEGLHRDAQAIWEYVNQVADCKNICLYGHSLGTGVVVRLAKELCDNKTPPAAVVLEAPFSSLDDVVLAYFSSKCPLCYIPVSRTSIETYLDQHLAHRFPSKARVADLTCPLMIIHGRLDTEIPQEQGVHLSGLYDDTSSNTCAFVDVKWGNHNNSISFVETQSALDNFLEKSFPDQQV